MKIMKKIAIILLATFVLASCSNDLENLNVNTKDPVEVSGESLFAAAQKRIADQMITPNVNLNNNRLWSQYWQETVYTDESNYNQITRGIPDNHWDRMYRVLKNLKRAAKIIKNTDNTFTNAQKPNKLAIIEIMTVYVYSNLVETFGNIPYSQALDIETTLPKYDDAATVYKKLIERLNTALASMDAEESFGAQYDLIYSGNVMKWKKFANSLKLRMGLVLADVNPGLSKDVVNSAYAAGVFASNADDADYMYAGSAPNNNPLNNELVLSGRDDYVAGKTLVSIMNTMKDPRRSSYFDPNINVTLGEVASVTETATGATITFTGNMEDAEGNPVQPVVDNPTFIKDDSQSPDEIGTVTSFTNTTIDVINVTNLPKPGDFVIAATYKGGAIGTKADYSLHSHPGRMMTVGSFPGTIFSYAQVQFLLAEAAARAAEGAGYSVGGTAEFYYKEGIKASFAKWGAKGVDDYLARPEVDYTQAIANSSSSPAWKEVIGTQAWIALYNESFAAWLTVRRLDYPIMTQPASADTGFPVRYRYPVGEQKLNSGNYEAAASAIGGDKPETQLFWDKYYTFGF